MRATEQRLKAIVIKELRVEDSEVSRDADFTEDLGADSLDIVEIMMDAEKEVVSSYVDLSAYFGCDCG